MRTATAHEKYVVASGYEGGGMLTYKLISDFHSLVVQEKLDFICEGKLTSFFMEAQNSSLERVPDLSLSSICRSRP
jgi:hypothetical protein